jgi:hypothetical protein
MKRNEETEKNLWRIEEGSIKSREVDLEIKKGCRNFRKTKVESLIENIINTEMENNGFIKYLSILRRQQIK